jgi:hypothetical protein
MAYQTMSSLLSGELSFMERILLISNVAIYICKFDIDMEKVSQFQRIPLAQIRCINKGLL